MADEVSLVFVTPGTDADLHEQWKAQPPAFLEPDGYTLVRRVVRHARLPCQCVDEDDEDPHVGLGKTLYTLSFTFRPDREGTTRISACRPRAVSRSESALKAPPSRRHHPRRDHPPDASESVSLKLCPPPYASLGILGRRARAAPDPARLPSDGELLKTAASTLARPSPGRRQGFRAPRTHDASRSSVPSSASAAFTAWHACDESARSTAPFALASSPAPPRAARRRWAGRAGSRSAVESRSA